MGSTIIVPFHGTDLLAILDDDRILVPLRPLVKGMGLDWSAQRRRVYRNPIMAEAVAVMATTPNDPDGLCLPLDLVPGFLFTVNAERVDEAVRAKVLDYQRECFRVLADACLGPRPSGPRPPPKSYRPRRSPHPIRSSAYGSSQNAARPSACSRRASCGCGSACRRCRL